MTPKTLRTLRRRLGLSQAAMAAQIGVAPNTVARWERGELGMRPTTDKLIRLLARSTSFTTQKRKARYGR